MSTLTLYPSTDIDMDFNVTGLTIPSLTEVVIEIIDLSADVIKQYKKSLNEITLAPGVISLFIPRTDFISTGTYVIRIRATEPDGKVRGIKLIDYDRIKFI